jgi:DNA-binding response OmpR family regulator
LTSTGETAHIGSQEGRVLFVYPPGPERDLYASALREAGFEATAEATVADAADLRQTTQGPDVIVIELLPDPVAAWTFIEQRCADHSGVALVILTSLIRPDRLNRRRAGALGCAAFVAKPCSLAQLVDVVSRVRRGERGLEISTYAEARTGEDH